MPGKVGKPVLKPEFIARRHKIAAVLSEMEKADEEIQTLRKEYHAIPKKKTKGKIVLERAKNYSDREKKRVEALIRGQETVTRWRNYAQLLHEKAYSEYLLAKPYLTRAEDWRRKSKRAVKESRKAWEKAKQFKTPLKRGQSFDPGMGTDGSKAKRLITQIQLRREALLELAEKRVIKEEWEASVKVQEAPATVEGENISK